MDTNQAFHVYLISGLGADYRIFSKLKLPPTFYRRYIDCVEPEKGESLNNYAMGLLTQIDMKVPFILIGASFGGMLAVEICKFIRPVKLILISSFAVRQQIPWYLRTLNQLGLISFFPVLFIKQANFIRPWLFGASTPEELLLLKQILNAADIRFLRWIFLQIPFWKQEVKIPNSVHIHGRNDHLFPVKSSDPDFIVNGGGGHLIVFTHADEVSKDLQKVLSEAGLG